MKIPTLDNQVQSTAAPQARVAYLDRSGQEQLGKALGEVGATVHKIQIEERNKADQAAVMDADVATSKLTNDLYNNVAKTQLKDAIGTAPKALQDFDAQSAEIEKSLTNDRQKRAYKAAREQSRLQFQRQVEAHERNQTEAYYTKSRNDYQAQQFTNAVTSYSDPQLIEQSQANLRASIDQTPGLDAEQKALEFADKSSKLYGAVIDRYLANDQLQAAEQYYKAVKPKISGNQLTQIENDFRIAKDRMKAKADAGMAEARQAYRDRAADIEADFRSRLPVAEIPSEAEAVALFGERGKRMHEQLVKIQKASIAVANLDNMNTAEAIKELEKYKPSESNRGAVTAEVYGVAAQSLNNMLAERQKDSVGYLQEKSPTVSAAYRRFSENPSDSTRAEYLSSIEAERVRLGIPGNEILSKAEEKAVIDRMTRQDDSVTLVNSIRQEEARWGKDFPRIFQQIGKDLPDTAYLIPNVSEKAASVLSTVSLMSDDELKKGIGSGYTYSDVSTDIRTGLNELRQSFPVDGMPAYQKIESAAVKLSIGYMSNGMSAKNAIRQAIADVTEQHDFHTYRDQVFRVPVRDERGNVLDSEAIANGAAIAIQKFTPPDRIVPGGSFEESARIAQDIKDTGYWVTAPDESGLWLFSRHQPVGNPPIAYTWDQLQQFNTERVTNYGTDRYIEPGTTRIDKVQ